MQNKIDRTQKTVLSLIFKTLHFEEWFIQNTFCGFKLKNDMGKEVRYCLNPIHWNTNRVLFLEGEGYFRVKKGSTFTVNTPSGSVTVLGTQFNVNSRNNYFEVICYEGKVSVKNKQTTHILKATDYLRNIEGVITASKVKTIQPNWISGESDFKSTPIKYVIEAMELHFNVQFDTQNIDENIVFTGSFSNNDLDTALKTVFAPLKIKYIKEDNTILLRLKQ